MEQLEYLSLRDPLTGIYNKLYYESEIRRLEGGREYPLAIVVADIDNLKIINESQGHMFTVRLIAIGVVEREIGKRAFARGI